jgi:hypothetical protein
MYFPHLSVDDLHAVVSRLPEEMRMAPGGRVIGVANAVIAHFLGADWFAAHIRHDAPRRGFMNLDFASDQRCERSTFRVVELAENLLNLQHIEGFAACVGQMRGGGEKIESTCAELDFGRLLYIHDIDFRFVVPQMAKGGDYDFEITYPDGLQAAADAKCKFETTAINPESLRNSMKKASGQLPTDQAGIIFVKVPQRWIEDPATVQAMIAVAREFMATTGRVVSIKFYVSHLEIGNGAVLHRHAFRELTNRSSRFHDGRNWDLFANYEVPSDWDGMPPKWQRIFFWPDLADRKA